MTNDKTGVKVGKWFLYALALPWTLLVGYMWVLLMFCTYAAHNLRMEEYGLLTAEWRPWAANIWRYSTTLGRGIIYWPGVRRAKPEMELGRTERHERVHVRQVEDLMFLSFAVGLVAALASGNWLLGFGIWTSGGAWQLPNFLAAVMRGGDIYRDTEHERSAYAQTDVLANGGAWLDQRGHD
jgi:hypothetical protein